MLHAENKKAMNQIDQGLDALSNLTGTLDQNAGQIGNELRSQIDVAKDINSRMDTTKDTIDQGTSGLQDVNKMSGGSLLSWIIMVILIVLCIACAFFIPIPKIKKD